MLANRLNQAEAILSGIEDKLDELEHSYSGKEKIRKYKWNIQDLWILLKDQTMIF
jgi:ribosomal silencing factor RsfS